MFRNLVNRHDLVRIARKLRAGALPRALQALSWDENARTRAAWTQTDRPPKHWHDVPAVRRRWNQLITGDPETEPHAHIVQRHLSGRHGLQALSVGCGTGNKELRWAETGVFAHILGVDLSEAAISEARQNAERRGLARVATFEVSDVRTMPLSSASYDVVLADSALHHISPLHPTLRRLHAALRPGGLLVLRDFVGPARFQWTERQMDAVRGLLSLLPEHYRTRWGSGTVKRSAYRPGRLPLRLSDPSEAAESDRTLGLLNEQLTLIERRDFGGTLLHLLFDEIAHHFLSEDEETQRWLQLCFRAEDALLASGELESDFVFAVFEKRV